MLSGTLLASWFRKLRAKLADDVPLSIAVLGMMVVLIPPILYGPWLPLLDLVSFVGLNNYPHADSAGPFHFYVFQLTYVGHHVLVRMMSGLGITTGHQVLLLYLAQAAVLFYVTQALIREWITDWRLASIAVAVGALSFWDGVFLWGGPLAFSLAAVAHALALWLVIGECERSGPESRIFVPLLCLAGMVCHPFAFPFMMVLAGLRFVFVPSRRVETLALATGLVLFAWILKAEAVEQVPADAWRQLFGFSVEQGLARLLDLFLYDSSALDTLFGAGPWPVKAYVFLLHAVQLVGFLSAPWVLASRAAPRGLKLLAATAASVAVMYAFSRDNTIVGEWPPRILSFYAPFTFVAGVALPAFLLRRRHAEAQFLPRGKTIVSVAAPCVALTALVGMQVSFWTLGSRLRTNIESARAQIVRTGVTNAFLMASGMDRVSPFYLRAVPMVLFSDPAIVSRHLLLNTEWHHQLRHATRETERWFDLGRPFYLAKFDMKAGAVQVTLVPLPPGQPPVLEGSNVSTWGASDAVASREFALADRLIAEGALRDAAAHYEAALKLAPDRLRPRNNLAVALIRLGRPAEAVEQLRRIVELSPQNADAHFNLGVALMKTDQPDEAIREMAQALSLQPRADWHLALGQALYGAGRKSEARRNFAAALELDPTFAIARAALEQSKGN